jgi:hypothetical protein
MKISKHKPNTQPWWCKCNVQKTKPDADAEEVYKWFNIQLKQLTLQFCSYHLANIWFT